MHSFEIQRNLDPTVDDLATLRRRFRAFVEDSMPGLPDEDQDRPFLFSLKRGAELLGAICGSVYWDGLEIDILWVDPRYRRQGLGRRLVGEAEDYARGRGAVIAFLKTVEARDFYTRLGYAVFGVLEDRPVGTRLYHMKKRLDD